MGYLRWLVPTLVAVAVAFLGFFAWCGWSIHERAKTQVAELKAANERSNVVIQELRKLTAPPLWVEAGQLVKGCSSDRMTVTCWFTNKLTFPAASCVQGHLLQKAGGNAKLESMPLCTGKIMPAETKVVTAPWFGGFADDICNKETGYGKQLDWSKCNFDTAAYDMVASLSP